MHLGKFNHNRAAPSFMLFELITTGIDLMNLIPKQPGQENWAPIGLEGDILLFFRDFRHSIESKNVNSLQKLIAEDYFSNSLFSQDKPQLVDYYQDFFGKVPRFASLSLEVLVCKLPEVRIQDVHLVIKPILKVQTLGITWLSGPFGTDDRLIMLLRRNPISGLFNIVNMERV